MSLVIKVSDEVAARLSQSRRAERGWDATLRRVLGLPSRKGEPQPLLELWVLPHSGIAKATKAEARGEAILKHAKTGGEIEKPIRMREVI